MAWVLRRMPYFLLLFTTILLVATWGCAAQTAQTPPTEASKTAAEPVISKIEAKQDGDKVRVAIVTSQPTRYKTIFKANNPLRVVVDIPGYKFVGVPAQQPVKVGPVESIATEAVEEGIRRIARININLSQMVDYEYANGVEALLLDFDMPMNASASPAAALKETAAPDAKLVESYSMLAAATNEPPKEQAAPEPKAAEPAKEKEAAKPAPTGGPVTISSFDIKNAPGAATVTIGADGPLGAYESFELPDPPRLVVDIPNATHAAPKLVTAKEAGVITKLRSSQYKDTPKKIVRVVLDLKNPLPYKIQTTDNQLVVQLSEGVATPAPAAGAPAETGKPAAVRDVIKIDFKMVDNKSRVNITASGKGDLKYNVNRVEDPPSIVLDLLDAKLAPSAKKTLDLRELPSAIAQIRAGQHQKEPQSIVRIVMDLRALVDYKVLPAARGLTVEVAQAEAGKVPTPAVAKPAMPVPGAPAAPAAPAVPAAPTEPPMVSMDFKDADIGNILRLLSEVGRVNIVVSEDVKAKVTVRLENVPWERALEVILKANGLAYVKEDSVIRVARADALKREEEDKLKARTLRDDLIPLITKIHSLNFAKSTDMAKSLAKALTKRGEIQVDERTNTLIIKDIPEKVDEIIRLAIKLDSRTPQVIIEARIVEVTTPDFERELGVQWGFQFQDRYKMTEKGKTGSFPRTVDGRSDSPDQRGGTTPFLVNVPVATALGSAHPALAGALTLSRALGLDTAQLDLRIQAHERMGDLKVVSSPKVSVLDNAEAEVQSGDSIPIQVVEQGEVSTKYIDANIDLKVTPHITLDNNIRLKVSAKKNAPDFSRTVNGNPVITKREATTEVLVKDGETIVIGGVFKGTDTRSENRVPWIGSIPVLGWFFKEQYTAQKNEELLIFITPQILKGV